MDFNFYPLFMLILFLVLSTYINWLPKLNAAGKVWRTKFREIDTISLFSKSKQAAFVISTPDSMQLTLHPVRTRLFVHLSLECL